jgi:LPPG:FO 2-phospho-L-lactate transferase
VNEIAYQGAAAARSPAAALAALRDPQLRAVILCPSNPFLSIGPILAVPGIRAALARCTAPVLAVSPIVGGQAVKGPTAKMMRELGLKVRAAGVADCYAGLIDALVTDDAGAGPAAPAGVEWITAPTLMVGMEERTRLARVVLAAADRIAATPRRARRGAAG